MSVVPGGQEVRPDVEGLVGELEEAQDAIFGGAAGVSVPWDDAVLVENLQDRKVFLSTEVCFGWTSLLIRDKRPAEMN